MITPARLLAIAGLLAIAVWPLAVQDVFLQRIGALVLLAAISASAWNLLGGYAGQVSVGHALYFGVGAYAGLVVYTEWGWPPIAGAPLGVAVSAALAVVVGLPTFRLRGHYFSMATIAAAELARILAANWPLLGAAVGLMGPPRPRTIADLSFTSPVPYHYLFLALLLSASFTSIAGTLYAVMVGFVDPDSVLGILVSVKMIIVAALGGAGTLYGPLVGSAILI